MAMLTRRRISAEHMDDPQAGRGQMTEALQFIRIVNRRLGGTTAAIGHLKKWSRHWRRDEILRIIDIGTGSADIPLAIANWAKGAGWNVRITAVDLHPVTVQLAREFIGARDDIEIVQADALKLMERFSPGSFDYAHAGMFLHHLQDIDAMTVLRIMDRLSRRGMIWNDLVRGWAGRVGVRAMMLGRGAHEHVRHDAIVSVEAGFTRREAMDLASRVGWQRIKYRRYLLHRFTLTGEGNHE